jgi:hypothetical protein
MKRNREKKYNRIIKKIMKKKLRTLLFILIPIMITGCEFIGDVFKTGVWVGVIIIIAIAGVIAFIVKLFSK